MGSSLDFGIEARKILTRFIYRLTRESISTTRPIAAGIFKVWAMDPLRQPGRTRVVSNLTARLVRITWRSLGAE